eukprot:TRINITY_DN3150_c0_g1_i1.p2 TRINITY_DN3150_c0_g1~~TRINITY_DN3150_c0_g1_i1.p2  ORF type:complete len:267 (+),score=119.22 TRINITY_DN3150_c0_g1_i1:131-931(+)
MIDAMMSEAVIELLEARLAEQEGRVKDRERTLEEIDNRRQQLEYEKASIRAEQRREERARLMDMEMMIIEQHAERERLATIAAEEAEEERRLQEELAGLTEEQVAQRFADLEMIAQLEEKLEHTSNSIQFRLDSTKTKLDSHTEHENELRLQRQAVEDEGDAANDALKKEEKDAHAVMMSIHDAELAAWEEAERQLREEEAAVALAAAREQAILTLKEADVEHICALSDDERNAILDEIIELSRLKSRYRALQPTSRPDEDEPSSP